MKSPRQIHNELIENINLKLNGGPGSGNFGHAGRPGMVGGSGGGSWSGKKFSNGQVPIPKKTKYGQTTPGYDLDSIPLEYQFMTTRGQEKDWSGGKQTRSDYYKTEKNQISKLVMIKPDDYIQSLIDDGPYPSEEVMLGRSNINNIAKYTKDMQNGDLFPPLLLSYRDVNVSQEGIHRAFASLGNGLEYVPLVVNYEANGLIPKVLSKTFNIKGVK